MDLQVLLLHKYPEYLKQCCDLLNEEWPRSETARINSLTASCDLLPTSLVLIDKNKTAIGHCKLTPIPSIPESCFIESVVVSKALRGKKLGTFLMKYAEQYCKDVLKLKMVHLSTKGQENFYTKLGYKICPPVSIYGGYLPMGDPVVSVPEHTAPVQTTPPICGAPPPPPPPMPKPISLNNNASTIKTNKTYMMKFL